MGKPTRRLSQRYLETMEPCYIDLAVIPDNPKQWQNHLLKLKFYIDNENTNVANKNILITSYNEIIKRANKNGQKKKGIPYSGY